MTEVDLTVLPVATAAPAEQEEAVASEARVPTSGTSALVERVMRQRHVTTRRRGWLVRRLLVSADVIGLLAAFLIAQKLFRPSQTSDIVNPIEEFVVFVLALPVWVVVANLAGLYGRDDERTDHSTADDLVGVVQMVTLGTWLVFMGAWLTHLISPHAPRMMAFWAAAITFIVLARALARGAAKRSDAYIQRTIIVGAGDVGQLVARKLVKHPEYGVKVLGFVDAQPKERREDIGDLMLLGHPKDLPELALRLGVDRIVIAFSNEKHEATVQLIRELEGLDIQIDVVPRLFEVVGPKGGIYTVEGLPLVCLPPARLSRSARMIKRSLDIVLSAVVLLFTAPLFVYIAWRIKRDSRGPVFFRQTRLGMNMREFTTLKFRTMYVDADDTPHREYIKSTMSAQAQAGINGLYKLERSDAVTPFGRWLRSTSLDELPQLINVLLGDMSLVGPRPCIPYEVESFAPHQFVRFSVPAGMTGLWQVMARAHSTFGEALDMDVAYARGWSLGLDLRLLGRTPLAITRQRGTA